MEKMSLVTMIVQIIFDLAILGIMIFAAISDGKTKQVPWWAMWTTLGIAVLHTVFAFGHYGIKEGFIYIGTGVVMALIYLIMLLIFKGKGIGGADSKMTTFLSLYLGLWPSLIMIIVHYVAAIGYKGYMSLAKHKTIKSVRLMIFLSIGYVVAKIVEWIAIFAL